ncbi:MAG: hypothetical protein FWG58_01525 [Methanomassiliicoccaceae archaeon]|nr:hypothetical protein [Methanomassiliicoccaceae archaeon]
MPSFADPFAGNVPKKMTKEELIQAVRLDLAGELEAAFLYDAHSMATDDPLAKEVLADIRDEEIVHMGELLELLRQLDPAEAKHFEEGTEEVREEMEKLKKKKK